MATRKPSTKSDKKTVKKAKAAKMAGNAKSKACKASPPKKAKDSTQKKPKKSLKKEAAAKTALPKAPKSPGTAEGTAVFSLQNKVQRQKDVAWRMIEGEAVIVTPTDSTMHTLNEVGTRIWELMTGSRTLRDMAGVLCTEFDVDRERAEKDTVWFVECLAKKGLVERL